MALFGKKTEKKEEEKPKAKKVAAVKKTAPKVKAEKKEKVASPVSTFDSVRGQKNVVIRPHITEKATMHAELHVYTFEVTRNSNKYEIKSAIKKLYGVTPVKVRIVNKATRHETLTRGRNRRPIRRPGMKKAYVTLKKGDQISFV